MILDEIIQQAEPLLLSGQSAKVREGKAILMANSPRLSAEEQQRLIAYMDAITPKIMASFPPAQED